MGDLSLAPSWMNPPDSTQGGKMSSLLVLHMAPHGHRPLIAVGKPGTRQAVGAMGGGTPSHCPSALP